MSKKIQLITGPTIYQKINAARMSESDRQTAISAMRDAELIVDGCFWAVKKIEQWGARLFQWGARLFLKPGLKH